MPIPAPPRHYYCPSCGWSKTVAPTGDVLMPGHDYFHNCPKCGHSPLDTKTVTAIPADLGQIIHTLGKWFKR